MKILILEDDYTIRTLYKEVLERAQRRGQKVIFEFALNYEEFIAKFAELKPDIVWLDHRVPGLQKGDAVAHWVRNVSPETKIIRMSSFREKGYPPGIPYLGKRYSFIKLYKGSRQWVETGEEPDWYF